MASNAFFDDAPLNYQVDLLSKFLLLHFPLEIKNGGAIETAIQILSQQVVRCGSCGKEAENKKLTIEEAININAVGGECFECTSKRGNSAA